MTVQQSTSATTPSVHIGGTPYFGPSANATNKWHPFGVPGTVDFDYDVVPTGASGVGLASNVSSPAAAGAITLTAGTGVTLTTINGVNTYAFNDFDASGRMRAARSVVVSTAGDMRTVTFSVTGPDFYLQSRTQSFTGTSNGSLETTKTFIGLTAFSVNPSTSVGFNIGTGDTLGLPFRVDAINYLTPRWSTSSGIDTGTFVAADLTSPTTATTGDVRGTYKPSTATNGTRRLVANIRFSWATLPAPYGVTTGV